MQRRLRSRFSSSISIDHSKQFSFLWYIYWPRRTMKKQPFSQFLAQTTRMCKLSPLSFLVFPLFLALHYQRTLKKEKNCLRFHNLYSTHIYNAIDISCRKKKEALAVKLLRVISDKIGNKNFVTVQDVGWYVIANSTGLNGGKAFSRNLWDGYTEMVIPYTKENQKQPSDFKKQIYSKTFI